MSSETNSAAQSTTGADAIDVAIASGIDFDGTPIPQAKLDLYEQVMGLEAGRQRSGVSNTMRSRIVRIGVKHIGQEELDKMLVAANFAPLKEKEIAFYYGGK
ncbi:MULTISPECIES: small RNA NsiR4-regulated ssr1528 family protein [unclassified Microcoleus]|uniref:small RNA NsiR4-regulated ssr1528 family protein n=2 Tax=Microcoleus TaxID=44471 RepID=UPI002FD56F62